MTGPAGLAAFYWNEDHMSHSEDYDLVVLGSGRGRLLAWSMASEGKRTAVVERRYVTGSCPSIACLPSKYLIHGAKVANFFRRGAEFGIVPGDWKIEMPAVQDGKRKMVDGMVVRNHELYRESGAGLIMGQGRFIKNKSTASGGETPKGSAVSSVSVRRSSVRKSPWGRRTAMKDWQSQAHVKWDCKYHVVILPKYRRKVLYGKMRRGIGQILWDLCRQKDIEMVEGKAMPDHIHMLLSVPPRYSIAMTIGYLKGKSAARIHRELLHTKGTLFGLSFWARGYCVSTVGLDEVQIRRYIREQEKLQRDRDQDQGELNLD